MTTDDVCDAIVQTITPSWKIVKPICLFFAVGVIDLARELRSTDKHFVLKIQNVNSTDTVCKNQLLPLKFIINLFTDSSFELIY